MPKGLSELQGLSEADAMKQAEQLGFKLFRVVERDGQPYACTTDVRDDRLSVKLQDDRVVHAVVR